MVIADDTHGGSVSTKLAVEISDPFWTAYTVAIALGVTFGILIPAAIIGAYYYKKKRDSSDQDDEDEDIDYVETLNPDEEQDKTAAEDSHNKTTANLKGDNLSMNNGPDQTKGDFNFEKSGNLNGVNEDPRGRMFTSREVMDGEGLENNDLGSKKSSPQK